MKKQPAPWNRIVESGWNNQISRRVATDYRVELTIAETRSSCIAVFESSRRIVEDATVVQRSLERGLDPSRRATSRHLAALVYKEAARIAYIYSGHSIRIPADCVRPFVLRHAEVQCASVPLVPIRAGISNRQPIPGPALGLLSSCVRWKLSLFNK